MTLLTHLLPGLLMGIALNCCGLSGMGRIRRMLALRQVQPLRCVLAALGFGMAVGALLMWLAVIDVDTVRVLPMHGGTLLGGIIAGVSLGLTGVTPGISLAAIGSGSAAYGLCGFLGCVAGMAAFRLIDGIAAPVRALLPASEMTIFATTLDHPFLLGGGFTGLACLGALLLAISLLLPRQKAPRPMDAPLPAPTEAAVPEALPEETFVASLPEEEPLVIDTVAEAPPDPEDEMPPEDDPDAIRELSLLDGESP